MSAIRNVGELASPYYLLEVWARREDIDIDPETFATLKRKARALVRDARGFELRDEDPDEDWRARRRHLLALDPLSRQTSVLDDGTDFELGVWSEPSGAEALLVGDLLGSDDPDERGADQSDPAATQFELALDGYQGDADWGVLLAGLQVRVYRRSSGISQQYLALDLDTLVELDDEPTWKAFAAMFRAPAFDSGPDGVPLVRRVVDESRRHAAALAADMRRDVVDAAEALIQGVLGNPANAALIGEATRARLLELFEESLYVLYRVLFVLYAESREVLPIAGRGAYATSYSVDHLVELARRGGARPDGTYFDQSLRSLFSLLWDGPTETTMRLGFDPVGGELFDPDRTPVFSNASIPDPAWERALASIALGAPDSPRRRLGRRSSFAELGVDQLGSIYEGLLVLEPYLAAEPAYLGTYKGDRRVFVDQDVDGFNVLRHLSPGDFVLESAGGRRKGSGSFYTPHEITEYLTHAAVDPLVDAIIENAPDDPEAAAREILELKICDPAMGSGAFLVQATRVLALALARVRALTGDGLVTPERVQHAKREVVRHCLYGVDLNPLAVALAKVSLWLETLEPGRPLSFLDAHLRCGDSLVGVNFVDDSGKFTAAELAAFPANAHKGLEAYLKNEAGEQGEQVLARLRDRKKPKASTQTQLPGIDRTEIELALEQLAGERERIASLEERSETLFDVQEAQEAFEKLEATEGSIRNRLSRAADFWSAQWFSDGETAPADKWGPVVPSSAGDFELIISALVTGREVPDRLATLLEAAEDVARRHRFFHWALEFPEVLLDHQGFDAVIGNPPWFETSPSDDSFFGTYDPEVFRRGVHKDRKAERKGELRATREVDEAWRVEARRLHHLSNYLKPESGRFSWYASDGQLRKGDANSYRQFLERAYKLLRHRGRLSQVLPDAFYVSNPATGLRREILDDGQVEYCWVFENRKKIFPIDGRIRVVLLGVSRGTGPTEEFKTAFFTGKDALGHSRALGLDELPAALTALDRQSPKLKRDQIEVLSPLTLSFPELQTALDAEVISQCATHHPPLNGDEGWGLRYCSELHKTNDSWRFKTAGWFEDEGATRSEASYQRGGTTWWPLVSGSHFYHLEFPVEGSDFKYWVESRDLRSIDGRLNPDGSSVFEHFRVGLRRVASPTNERSSIACVLPPGTASDNSVNTVWGGSQNPTSVILLATLLSSFCFDYLVRSRGATNLSHGVLNAVPAPGADLLLRDGIVQSALEVLCQSSSLRGLWDAVDPTQKSSCPRLSRSQIAERRARLDAIVAHAYGLSLEQFAAILVSFPNLDLSQPMLPGEPKCFVTRDLALRAYSTLSEIEELDVGKLMREIGSGLPDPSPAFRDLNARIEGYADLGAVPYRPTPRGARTPTDPALIEEVVTCLSSDPLTAGEIAGLLGEEESTVTPILKDLKKSGEIYAEGRGKKARYYVLEED